MRRMVFVSVLFAMTAIVMLFRVDLYAAYVFIRFFLTPPPPVAQ